jgi:hypothetical protein
LIISTFLTIFFSNFLALTSLCLMALAFFNNLRSEAVLTVFYSVILIFKTSFFNLCTTFLMILKCLTFAVNFLAVITTFISQGLLTTNFKAWNFCFSLFSFAMVCCCLAKADFNSAIFFVWLDVLTFLLLNFLSLACVQTLLQPKRNTKKTCSIF